VSDFKGNPSDDKRDPLDVLSEAFLAAVRRGEPITPEGFAAQHPEGGAELRDLCETLLMLEGAKRDRETSATGGRRLVLPQLERLGDYRIVREVGRGGMGVVFEAVQESLDRRVALKVMPQASLLSGNQLERFRREAQTAARLHHTHIVPVFDSGEADGLHFYAMQFIDGEGLDAVVKALRKEPRPEGSQALRDRFRLAARIGADVADALHHAHEHGALHRDVKPANLLLDRDGHVWVTDFGLAKALEQNGLTNTGDVLGTLQYMAPEQFAGRYDARSEVYALGVTLWEFAALRPAFAAESRGELVDLIRQGKCAALRRIAPSAPQDLETILARAMAVDPLHRYASAAELARDLRAFLDDRPIAARRQTGMQLLWAWCRRNRALAGSLATAAAAIALAAIVGWGSYWTTRDALRQAQVSESMAREKEAVALQASERDRANLADSLQVFEDVFDTIVGPDPLDALLEDADGGGTTFAAERPPVDGASLALLQRMLEFYDRFAERNRDNMALRQQTARSYARVGAIQQRLGANDQAVAAYERAVALLREGKDAEQRSELAAVLQEFGQVQARLGQPRIAASCYAESLEVLSRASGDATRNDRRLSARAHYLLATAPGFREGRDANGRRGPSGSRPGQEERGAGRRMGNREGRGDPNRNAPPEANPGQFLREAMAQQRFDQLRQQAKSHLDAAIATLDALLAESPSDADSSFLRARCLIEIGRHGQWVASGSIPDPIAEAADILRRLVQEHPHNDAFRFALCEALVPRSRGRGVPAPMPRVDLAQAIANARALVAQKPQHLEYQVVLARVLSMQGAKLHESSMQKDPKAGIPELEEALAIHRAMSTANVASDARFAMEQVQTLRRLLRAELDSGDLESARGHGREIVALLTATMRDGSLPPRGDDRLGDLPQLFERIGMQDALRELQDAERRRR